MANDECNLPMSQLVNEPIQIQLRMANDECNLPMSQCNYELRMANDEFFAGFAVLGGLCVPCSGIKTISNVIIS